MNVGNGRITMVGSYLRPPTGFPNTPAVYPKWTGSTASKQVLDIQYPNVELNTEIPTDWVTLLGKLRG